MKRILLAVFILSVALFSSAQSDPLRVYINPGHGDWGPLSRPMATVNYAAYDTLGFFESNTNLWKAFALQEKLKAAGYEVMMSREENGPYPYVYGDESIDKSLLDIGAEANQFGAHYFISIHSNANVDGDFVNYPLFLYAGTDETNNIPDSYRMANTAWPRHFEAFGNDQDHTNIDHGFEPNSHYSLIEPNLRGDESFYGGTGLKVLEGLTCPGYLVEGYFHTYQPARHRALNPEWCRQEGIRYFRGIQDYFGKPDEEVGYIMGCVRDISEWFSHPYYTPMQSSYDPHKPINGAKVVLRDASGNIIRTECYRHVARHITDQYYYTTDHNYNGIFVFENLLPGTYTLTVHADGYEDKEMEVTVTANKTVYPEIFLTSGTGGTEPNIDVDVQWVLNGGKVDGTLPSKIEDSEYTLPTPTRAGYIFLGWYANAEGTGTALETLPVDYKGTVYALWQSTSVTWQLNGGHVSENKLLWEDFQNYFNEYYGTDHAHRPINEVLEFWPEGYDEYCKILVADPEKPSKYSWLGDYLWSWSKEQGMSSWGVDRYRNLLKAFLNCEVYQADVTVDFTELGKYYNWKSEATDEIRQKVTLPNQITSEYKIPTPEKEGFDFVGWYDNPNGEGEKLTTLPAGYNSTVYAIWNMPTLTKVVWVLNDGHVYPSNDWLWQDFITTFNSVSATEFTTRPETYDDFSDVWGNDEYNTTSCNILIRTFSSTDRYYWLGDYLWAIAKKASQDNMSGGNEWWGKLLWACLNCTACEYTVVDENTAKETTITVDFSVAGQPKSWRTYAETHKNDPEREEISPEFYNEIILPTTIQTDYTIPTPEKEGYTFQGWYNNHKGEGDPITVLPQGSTGMIYAIWQAPVPCIVAYDLNCNYLPGKMAFEFSFYANTQPTAAKLIFYNAEGQPTKEYPLSNLRQGKNTISIQAESLHALGLASGQDIYWDVELEARPSTLFAEIFRSQPFNTAYATIDNSPASDFFGSIWVANQKAHGYNTTTDGEIWRLVPENGYARDEGAFADGFEVIFRPTVAPDGKVYITDNGQSKGKGGVFVMDPHTPKITTNFFEGCTPTNGGWKDEKGEWKDENGVWKNKNGEWIANNDNLVGSGSTGAHIYWTEDGNNQNGFQPTTSKLFLMHNTHLANNNDDNNGETRGFFVYDLMGNTPSPQYTKLKNIPNQIDGIQDHVNTSVTDYAIVGTSRGAWVCQTRNEDKNVISDPSLTFYPNEGDPTIFTNSLDNGIFGDNELIHGSWGSAIAVNKAENLLAMVGGTGNIMLFDITWNGSVPTLSNKRDYPIVADDSNTNGIYDIPTITTLNFDYAGNLVATLGETYNDSRDQHQVAIFTLPKAENKVDVPARKSQFVPSLVEDEQCASVAKADMIYETVKLYRKLQSGMYNTICLPFGLTTLTGTPLQGASVLEFIGSTVENKGGEPVLKLNFEAVTAMTAGVPYLIKPPQDIKDPMLFSRVTMGEGARYIKIDGITFQGVMDPTELPNQNMLMLVANNRLATSTGGTMQGNRGYFVIDNPQNMPKRAEIAIVKGAPSSDDYIHIDDYQPTVTKVLENGVILIIRDGVKYNLMGARVR